MRCQTSSGFSTLSMNDGIGVPRTPTAIRLAMSVRDAPPRKDHGLVRLAGRIGCPQSSFSSARDGPSARPWSPWHLLHSMASYISRPRLIDSADDATSRGSSTRFGASSRFSGAKRLRYATRFQRSFSGSTAHGGIEVPGMPSVMTRKRSWSVGTLVAVERTL